jgi:EmrB/QacA subfamily drug resistance transporter
MSILDTNIINIALPSILKDFDSSLQNGQLVITSYVMALAVVIPVSGFLGERIGMKRLYMITLACFTVGSALCGLAWNVQSLIFFRVLQGLGGGMLQPVGMAIVFTMIAPIERPRFIALLGIPNLLAPLLGPSFGGYLVEFANWRLVFLINVPIGLVDIFLAYHLLKETPVRTGTRMDFRGFAYAALAFPCLLLAMSRGSEYGWDSPSALVLFAVGAVALAAFIRHELTDPDPMLRLRLFSIPMFRLSLIIQWIGIFSLFGLNVVIPLYLQRVHGLGAAAAGRVLLPMGIVAFATLNLSGSLYNRLGPRPIVMCGLGVLSATTFLWSRVTPGTSTLILTLLVAARGLGQGMFGQMVQVVSYNSVPEGELPRATALVNVCQRLATAFSTAILTTVLIVGLGFTDAPPGASIASGTAPVAAMQQTFNYAFLLMTGVSLAGMVLAFFLRDRVLEEHLRALRESKAVLAASRPGRPLGNPNAK